MNDDELRAALRGADPAAGLPPADPARVADLLEAAVSTTRPTPDVTAGAAEGGGRAADAGARRRRPWVVALAVAAAAAAVAAVAVPVVGSLEPEPVTTTLTAEPFDPATASCPGVAVSLTQVDTAFAGRVASVDGTRVVLDVERVYRGEPGERVVVDAPQQDGTSAALVGGFGFEVGGEYLVAAGAGRVAVCGASGPADPALQAEYDRAFG
ncbi:hypothetical protein ACUN7V_10030 [Quadrisphaera oryzae]|uniref:hypothetical protein n=1 Tax=Quadrisphaera TaxID=317661 RepID=UPI0016493DD5|nr:hypothetical protein [Quadrisphaera sp. RL12-1S]MBC3760673.1 hypothetical protein [Quadrisphaera sp. RL12-1S]